MLIGFMGLVGFIGLTGFGTSGYSIRVKSFGRLRA